MPTISCVPKDIIINEVFPELPINDLYRVARVCKAWKEYFFSPDLWKALDAKKPVDIRKLFPTLTIVDASSWKKHLQIDVADAPQLSTREYIQEVNSFLNDVKKNFKSEVELTDLVLPKGTSFFQLYQLIRDKAIGKGFAARMEVPLDIYGGLKDFVIEKTCRVLITDSVLIGTRKKTFKELKGVLQEIKCEVPKAVAILALNLFAFLTPSKQENAFCPCYRGEQDTFTFCAETLQSPLVVGWAHSSNPVEDVFKVEEVQHSIPLPCNGIGAMREIKASSKK